MYSSNNRRLIFLVPVFIAVAFFATVIGLSLYYHGTSPAYYGPPFFYGWWGFFPGFFIIPVIFLAFFAFRWIFWGGWGWGRYYGNEDPAIETLKQRYARGEISKEQFEQMAKDLEQQA